MVRAGGVEPPRAFAQRIFLPSTAFAALARLLHHQNQAGLWSGLSLHPSPHGTLGAARLVSTPSPAGTCGLPGLGSGLPC
ncbi:MAG: hypothetical protein D6773_00290 [Alphaproteobacteria bacterium]|nr:MAG: hypothetical protein D6773_00290 [Alphaproteobacteria bacterium]